MGKARAEIVIDKPADEVWARIRDYFDLSWYLGVESVSRQGEDRTVKMHGFQTQFVERPFSNDDAARTYSYGIIGVTDGPTKLEQPDGSVFELDALSGKHKATMTVNPKGESASWLTYDLELDLDDDTVQSTIRNYQAVLDHLKAQLES